MMTGFTVRQITGIALCGVSVLASACSSSGGGSTPPIVSAPPPPNPVPAPPAPTPPAPAPTPAPPNFDTAEFQNQSGLSIINALPAYDAGGDGSGVIVSIIDTGIDLNNPEFEGRIHPDSADLVIAGIVAPGDVRAGGPTLQDNDDHGTPVASIIGAARDDVAVHGVAPEAELLIFRADDETDVETILGAAISEGINRSITAGADVLNFSLGSDEPGARSDFANIFTATAANDILTAVAAGNDGDAEPDASALGALDVAGDPATIVVGALNPSGTDIASFSDRAGSAQDIYILAPGTLIPTIGVNTAVGETAPFSGTSAATPHVAGAAALILQLWPTLTASEVVTILLDSARDLGAPGTDAIYGRGILDIGAAIAPLGPVTTSSVNGVTSSVSSLGVELAPVFGAGLQDVGEIVVFDSFGRDFVADLGDAIGRSAPRGFDVEGTFSPFETRSFASRRLSAGSTVRFRMTERDLTAFAPGASQLAAFDGIDPDADLTEETLAFAFTNQLSGGETLTVAQGFAARTLDSMVIDGRSTPFITNSAFSDAFLPEGADALSGLVQTKIARSLTADFLVTYDFADRAEDPFLFDPLLDPVGAGPNEATSSAFRAGINYASPGLRVRFEQGLRRESGAFLGAQFGENTEATTVYGAIEASWRLTPLWSLAGRYSAGYSEASTDGLGALVDGFSGVVSTQFSTSLIRDRVFGASDQFWVGVSQPLQVEAGEINLIAPTDYDPLTDSLTFTSLSAPIALEGRRYDVEAGYRLLSGPLGALDINLLHQRFAEGEIPPQTTFVLRGGFDF